MADEQQIEIAPHPAEPVHFVTAAIAAMALVPLVGSALSLGNEPGTEPWQNGLTGLSLAAGLYLLVIAFEHLGHAWRGQSRPPATWSIIARVMIDLAVAGVAIGCLVRGPASRLLLAGLSDALPGLIAAAGVSAVVTIYRWLRTPAPLAASEAHPAAPLPPRGIFHLLIAAGLIGGLLVAESQPLPRVLPDRHAAQAEVQNQAE